MKRNTILTFIFCIVALLFTGIVSAQEEDSPVIPPFETLTLIDNQTTVTPYKGGLVMEIQHRFSEIKEFGDLFGIYGSANTRMGMTYGITDKIMVGFGTTRNSKLQDLEWKYNFLTQTESGRIPVSLAYHGNAVLDARAEKYFGEEPKSAYRLSYLNQLIVSRRFGDKLGFQVAPTFVWFNAVPEGYNNANVSVNVGGRLQVLGFHSIIFEYDQPLLATDQEVYPNLALGVELGTSTHSFRVFASNYNAIVRNHGIAFNGNNPFEGDFQFGFNITIRFR
jgi:hypothetical protein